MNRDVKRSWMLSWQLRRWRIVGFVHENWRIINTKITCIRYFYPSFHLTKNVAEYQLWTLNFYVWFWTQEQPEFETFSSVPSAELRVGILKEWKVACYLCSEKSIQKPRLLITGTEFSSILTCNWLVQLLYLNS